MQNRLLSLFLTFVGIALVSCKSSYTEDIGGDFILRTRVYSGMAHEYKEYDLYYKGTLGIRRLVHRDIINPDVSPKGDVVVFLARRQRPEPIGMDYILYVFDRKKKDLIKVEEGEFHSRSDFWSPKGDKFVYMKSSGPIMLYDLSTHESRVIAGRDFYFLGWSPSGKKVAYVTDKSIYEVNTLYLADVEEMRGIQVSEKTGEWKKEDFEWVTVDDEETIRVKQDQG